VFLFGAVKADGEIASRPVVYGRIVDTSEFHLDE
jgi:hypothetical protein